MNRFVVFLVAALVVSGSVFAAEEIPTIEQAVAGADSHPGYFNFYYDASGGRLLLEIERFDEEFLYVNSLATGVGSNDIGLDRGQIGDTRVVEFQRYGNKVLLKQINLDFRAQSDNELERLAVEEAFAESVLWGFEVMAESDRRVLVDATGFLLRDAHGVVNSLAAGEQGNYTVDASRSAVYMPRTRNFPLNTEFEALLTYTTGARGGSLVRTVSPDPQSISVRLHHSLVQLPDSGYQPRRFHPKSGFWARDFEDYAAPVNEDMTQRFIGRHRLQKLDPNAAASEAVEPIVYYLDPGVPEPVRSALLDGARWWADAFEAAGFRNGFQVELLPEDVDPMDIRYNVIQWVHRSTRGWSYGSSVIDPRTGEIIKGKVTLGSLRVRQDYRIAQSLIGLAMEGADESIQQLALSRIRQLSAHEVGHTLGIAHNFAASVNQRASVMDYPHPLIDIDDRGVLNALNAYDVGLGQWDYQVIKYGYSEYSNPREEAIGLANTLQESADAGLLFISDQDSRPPGSSHPLAHMWDNGAYPTEELEHLLEIRREALSQFGRRNIRAGQPYAELEEVLVPLYLLHRYQIEAAHRLIGGTYYDYAVYDGAADATDPVLVPVPADEQLRALDALIATLDTAELTLPTSILELIPPKPIGYSRGRESFSGRTFQNLDYVAMAETLADHVVSGALHPQRLTRVSNLHGIDRSLPTVYAVVTRLLDNAYRYSATDEQQATVQRALNHVILYRLMELVRHDELDNQVKSQVALALRDLRDRINARLEGGGILWLASHQLALDEIDSWFEDGSRESLLTKPLPMPPGAPI